MAYTQATANDLKTAFPKFAAVDDATIEFWLTRARRSVDGSWTEDDRAMGEMLLACHLMTLEGLGTGTEAQIAAEGLGDFQSVRSGQFSFTRAEGAAGGAAAGTIGSTAYGRQFSQLRFANVGGARLTPTGVLPDVSLYPGA
jgi:hypothetical protein